MSRTFNRANCKATVRSESFTNKFGDRITLVGRHSYEWEVVITPIYGPTKCMIFREGRIPAQKYFREIKGLYKDSKRRVY